MKAYQQYRQNTLFWLFRSEIEKWRSFQVFSSICAWFQCIFMRLWRYWTNLMISMEYTPYVKAYQQNRQTTSKSRYLGCLWPKLRSYDVFEFYHCFARDFSAYSWYYGDIELIWWFPWNISYMWRLIKRTENQPQNHII